jgi:hypothetical protein
MTKTRHPCARHNLWFAHSPVPTASGRYVYLVCGCDRIRVVAAETWQRELTRRATRKETPHG